MEAQITKLLVKMAIVKMDAFMVIQKITIWELQLCKASQFTSQTLSKAPRITHFELFRGFPVNLQRYS